jgi:hypothetical protein
MSTHRQRRQATNSQRQPLTPPNYDPPSEGERAAFIDAIMPSLFGQRYLIVQHARTGQFALCTTWEYSEHTPFHAQIMTLN